MTNDGVLLYGIKITACSRAVDWSLLQWSCGRTEWRHNNCTSASKKHRITLSLINALHILYCNDTVDKIRQAAAVPLAGGDLQLPGAGPHLPPPDLPRLAPPQPAQVPGGAARVHPRHRHRQLHQAHSQLQRHRTQVQTLASLIIYIILHKNLSPSNYPASLSGFIHYFYLHFLPLNWGHWISDIIPPAILDDQYPAAQAGPRLHVLLHPLDQAPHHRHRPLHLPGLHEHAHLLQARVLHHVPHATCHVSNVCRVRKNSQSTVRSRSTSTKRAGNLAAILIVIGG